MVVYYTLKCWMKGQFYFLANCVYIYSQYTRTVIFSIGLLLQSILAKNTVYTLEFGTCKQKTNDTLLSNRRHSQKQFTTAHTQLPTLPVHT